MARELRNQSPRTPLLIVACILAVLTFSAQALAEISGAVRGSGTPFWKTPVRLYDSHSNLVAQAITDANGAYFFSGLEPGDYFVNALADGWADQWSGNVTHRSLASPVHVDEGTTAFNIDFDLVPGQSPALVNVTSDPAGAFVYIDYQLTTNITPAVIDIGEVSSHSIKLASHAISVRKPGYPYPSPRPLPGTEADTVDMHFDLNSVTTGSLSIASIPEGAEVYVDYADAPVGVTPLTLGGLIDGPHMVFLKRPSALQPMPVRASVRSGTNLQVTVPLTPVEWDRRLLASVHSHPDGVPVFVDYLATTNVTDVTIDWMDAASHASYGWHSVSHTIMLRNEDPFLLLPKYVSHTETKIQLLDFAEADSDRDGLPDWWELLHNLDPTRNDAEQDIDLDGLSNFDEFGFGSNPRLVDTDSDGIDDFTEWMLATDPADGPTGGFPSSLSGRITGGGIGLPDARVLLRSAGDIIGYQRNTDSAGHYSFVDILPGHYYIKIESDGYQDEWYREASRRSDAERFRISSGADLRNVNFDLAPGQSPAFVRVTSEPPGATVYLDYQRTTNVTPILLSIEDTASHVVRLASRPILVIGAARAISVYKEGYPLPSPVDIHGIEADTINLFFDLTGSDTGEMFVTTVPEGAEVFVDYADDPVGVSPVVVSNLLPGSHTILIKGADALRPPPLKAIIAAGETRIVDVPLHSSSSESSLDIEVRSVPTGAQLYVNYLPTTNVTDVIVDWLDVVSHSGFGWEWASHTVMVRKDNYPLLAPQVVHATPGSTEQIIFNLLTQDSDSDGLPDTWEISHGTGYLTSDSDGDGVPDGWEINQGLDPRLTESDNDPDNDRVSNEDEFRNGSNPFSPDSDDDGVDDFREIDTGRDPARPDGGPSTIFGFVHGGGVVAPMGYLQLRGKSDAVYYTAFTDPNGLYSLEGVFPGDYFVKAGAPSYADEWSENVNHRSAASAYSVEPNTTGNGPDFDLAPGQSPAFVSVSSYPSGAAIYIDYQLTTNVTPATVSIGETIFDGASTNALPLGYASHTISVKKDGFPLPSPIQLNGVEAETVATHFDLMRSSTGQLIVTTSPDGAEVFVDYADVPVGVTPIIVGNLLSGSHTVLLRRPGAPPALQPMPIHAWIDTEEITHVDVPLRAALSPSTLDLSPWGTNPVSVAVSSVPSGAQIYVDYLPTTHVTDAIVGLLESASHAGYRWHSVSHTIMLRKAGFLDPFPRYVVATNSEANLGFFLVSDVLEATDVDFDGLPDQWETSYGLDIDENSPEHGRDGDPDKDGFSNYAEMIAGTDPRNANSSVSIESGESVQNSPFAFVITWSSTPGRRYLVQCSSLLSTTWSNLSGVITSTSASTTYSDTRSSVDETQYYRIIVFP
jgi:hypothetical protein